MCLLPCTPLCPHTTGKRPGWHDGSGEVALHPSSICHPLETQQFQRPYLTYLEKVSRSFRCFGGSESGARRQGATVYGAA